MSKSFPEINALNRKEVNAALALGYANLSSITGDRTELHARLVALEIRKLRLKATANRIAAVQGVR